VRWRADGPDQHLARLDAVGRADDALALHPLDDLGGLVVAEPHLALELGDRDLLHPGDELDRLVVGRVVVALAAGVLARQRR
jgi:hypothetical protein